jgi:hypothetical protein
MDDLKDTPQFGWDGGFSVVGRTKAKKQNSKAQKQIPLYARDDSGRREARTPARYLLGVPRGSSELSVIGAGLQRIGPCRQRQLHPVGKDETVPDILHLQNGSG